MDKYEKSNANISYEQNGKSFIIAFYCLALLPLTHLLCSNCYTTPFSFTNQFLRLFMHQISHSQQQKAPGSYKYSHNQLANTESTEFKFEFSCSSPKKTGFHKKTPSLGTILASESQENYLRQNLSSATLRISSAVKFKVGLETPCSQQKSNINSPDKSSEVSRIPGLDLKSNSEQISGYGCRRCQYLKQENQLISKSLSLAQQSINHLKKQNQCYISQNGRLLHDFRIMNGFDDSVKVQQYENLLEKYTCQEQVLSDRLRLVQQRDLQLQRNIKELKHLSINQLNSRTANITLLKTQAQRDFLIQQISQLKEKKNYQRKFLAKQMKRLAHQLTSQKSCNDHLRDSVKKLKGKLGGNQLIVLQQQIVQAKQLSSDLKNRLNFAQSQVQSQQDSFQSLQQINSILKKSLTSLREQNIGLLNSNKCLQEQIQNACYRLQDSQKQLQANHHLSEQLSTKLTLTHLDHEEIVQKLHKNIQNLQQQLLDKQGSMQKELIALRTKIAVNSQQLSVLEASRGQQQQEVLSCKCLIRQQQCQIKTLKDISILEEQRIRELQLQWHRAKDKMSELEMEKEDLLTQIKRLQSQSQSLQTKFNMRTDQSFSANRKLEHLTEVHNQKLTQLSSKQAQLLHTQNQLANLRRINSVRTSPVSIQNISFNESTQTNGRQAHEIAVEANLINQNVNPLRQQLKKAERRVQQLQWRQEQLNRTVERLTLQIKDSESLRQQQPGRLRVRLVEVQTSKFNNSLIQIAVLKDRVQTLSLSLQQSLSRQRQSSISISTLAAENHDLKRLTENSNNIILSLQKQLHALALKTSKNNKTFKNVSSQIQIPKKSISSQADLLNSQFRLDEKAIMAPQQQQKTVNHRSHSFDLRTRRSKVEREQEGKGKRQIVRISEKEKLLEVLQSQRRRLLNFKSIVKELKLKIKNLQNSNKLQQTRIKDLNKRSLLQRQSGLGLLLAKTLLLSPTQKHSHTSLQLSRLHQKHQSAHNSMSLI